MNKLKRAVIKQELVELTGDFKKAIVLNQMIYWSERRKDADKFLAEEIERSKMAMGHEAAKEAEKLQEIDLFSHGWIYKSATELSEETMIGASKPTMGRYLDDLVKNEWLDRRKNPKWKGDNTFQYRVNLVKIQQDLYKLGYALEGYALLSTELKNETAKLNNLTSELNFETPSNILKQPVSKLNNITIDYSIDYSKNLEEEERIKQIAKSYAASILEVMKISETDALETGNYLVKYGAEIVPPSAIRGGWENVCEQSYAGVEIGNLPAYFAKCILTFMKRKKAAAEGMQRKEEQYNAQPQTNSSLQALLQVDIFK